MEKVIKIGEFVQIIAKIERSGNKVMLWDDNGYMDRYLNDDGWHRVVNIREGIVQLNMVDRNFWSFLPECLSNSIDRKDIVKLPIELKKAKLLISKKAKPKKQSLRAIVEERVKEYQGYSISSYAIRTNNDKEYYHTNDVCYARLSLFDGNAPKEVAVSLGNSERIIGKENMPLYRKYAKYILESPAWGAPFLTRNVNTAFRYGILMDVNQPLSRIMGSLTALREGVEFKDKLNIFCKFLDKGYSGDIAYFISSCFSLHNKDYILCLSSNGHKILTKAHTLKGIVDFFKNGYRDIGEKPYTEQFRSFSCQKAVCNTGATIIEDIRKLCIMEQDGEGWHLHELTTEENLFKFADILTEMIGKK